jgi:DMSO reductase family type II enzyme chaperone
VWDREGRTEGEEVVCGSETLQSAIDRAVARAFLHRFLAQAYEYPTRTGWNWLRGSTTRSALRSAVAALAAGHASLLQPRADAFETCLADDTFDAFTAEYVAAFGHAARGSCPVNEIEYGDLKADPLFQPHRLADLAAFYRAFGLELGADADERPDHICIELEFMSVLAAKEAHALETQADAGELAVVRHAEGLFLREHLGRWTPAFCRRTAGAVAGGPLAALARLTQAFVEAECGGFGVTPGSEDLLLRPVDEGAALCTRCGIQNLPPGALTADGEM